MSENLRSHFQGKTAVITGAASGIGAGLARCAASLGMGVVLADIQEERLQQVAATLPVPTIVVPLDLSVSGAALQLAERAYESFEHVDLVFNNAGVMTMGRAWEIERDRFDRVMAVNVGGMFDVVRAFVPKMLADGVPSRIVNTASLAGLQAYPLISVYAASKFAVMGFTEALHYELQLLKSNVTVSVLIPGSVASNIFKDPVERARQSAELRAHVDGSLERQKDNEIDADECASRTFTAIARGRYWIIPQPEYVEALMPNRVDMILRQRQPELSAGFGLPDENSYGNALSL